PQDAERLGLGMAGRLPDVVYRGRGHARRDERLEQFRRLPFPRALLEQRDQLSTVCDPVRISEEARVAGQLREAEDAAERGEELVVTGDDHQLAVARREDLVRRNLEEGAPLAPRHCARAEVADGLEREELKSGL